VVAALVFYLVDSSEVEVVAGTESTTIKMSRTLTAEVLSKELSDPEKGRVLNAFLNAAGYYQLPPSPDTNDPNKSIVTTAVLNQHGYYKLEPDKLDARIASILKEKGIMNVHEKDIADRLATDLQALVDKEQSSQTNAVDESVALRRAIERVPSVQELRERSVQEKPPFQAIATPIGAGKPTDQPSEYQIYVSDPQFIGRTVLITNPKQRDRALVVYAKRLSLADGVPPLAQLRSDQFEYLELVAEPSPHGHKGDTATILINRDTDAECFQQPVRRGDSWTVKKKAVMADNESMCK
jgi:hypothetical protein